MATANAIPREDPEQVEHVLEHLVRVPIFQMLAPEGMRALADIARIVSYAPGETIFNPGDAATRLHVVLEGTVRLLEETTDGPLRMAATREPGQCYGEIGFLTDQPRHMGALNGPTPGRHVVVDRTAFDALASRIPAIGQAVLTAVIDTLVRRMENVPPYVRDYLVWGQRPRVSAPPAPRGSWGQQVFLGVGAGWGVVATVLWIGIEQLFMPQVVRTITSMGLTMIALTLAGALAGLALSAALSFLERSAE